MLTHQSSWKNLRSTIDQVLAEFNPALDGGAVLDFLSACLLIPKLWLGRDTKHEPKREEPQDVFDLREEQLRVLVDYHLDEAVQGQNEAVLSQRGALFQRCLSSRLKAEKVADYLKFVITEEKQGRENAAKKLLLQIYLKVRICVLIICHAFTKLSKLKGSL